MKTLKESILNRSSHLAGEDIVKKSIDDWLTKHTSIEKKYRLDDKYRIEIVGDIHIHTDEEKFPDFIQFTKVSRNCTINNCPNLISLQGCPRTVGKCFSIHNCPKLVDLDECPRIVKDYFYSENNGRRFSVEEITSRCKVPLNSLGKPSIATWV